MRACADSPYGSLKLSGVVTEREHLIGVGVLILTETT